MKTLDLKPGDIVRISPEWKWPGDPNSEYRVNEWHGDWGTIILIRPAEMVTASMVEKVCKKD